MQKRSWHGRKRYGATHKVNKRFSNVVFVSLWICGNQIQDGSSLSIRILNRNDTDVNCPL